MFLILISCNNLILPETFCFTDKPSAFNGGPAGKRAGQQSNSKHFASWTVMVDAKDANAVAFYKKYGFMEIPATPSRLFLPMVTITKSP
jgi:hypothetical protein